MVDTHQAIIHKICRIYRDTHEDQEDLFQEIIYQLWKAFPDFRNESKVSTWMYRIALNTALAAFRKNRIALDFKATISEEFHPLQESMLLSLVQVSGSLSICANIGSMCGLERTQQ